jgi:hypothetical protein
MSTAKRVFSIDGSNVPKQRIHTPRSILDPIAEFWPEGIAMDPCGSPDGIVSAQVTISPETGGDGLAVDWDGPAFINPPYRNLKDWLAHGLKQDGEQIWLIPVRTHRKWWRAFEADCDSLIWLDPISFVGYDQKFPAPLCLAYRGIWGVEFDRAFAHLGGVRL